MPDEHFPADDLIARTAGGDREAFALLYRQFRPDVYRFAAHMSGSPTLADDVVHEVFLAVIESAPRYRPGRAGVLPWLLGIARNHVRRWRSLRPSVPLPGDETETARRIAIEPDPLEDMSRRRHHDALRRALIALPIQYREAIVLCDLQELTYEDAARTLGCAIGTVRSRIYRGRALLARALSDVRNDLGFRSGGITRRAGLKPCATGVSATGTKLS
jgi:RNA polymerase sigma-70 factor (ECF subfamily)